MTTSCSRLRDLLNEDRLHVMPCCFDALSAKLVEQGGFDLTFMSGFAASASRIGAPDVGLMSYGEVLDQARYLGLNAETVEQTLMECLKDSTRLHERVLSVRRK